MNTKCLLKPILLKLTLMAMVWSMFLVLTGCATAEPYEFHPIDEIPEGPGLFSGEDGEFILFRR